MFLGGTTLQLPGLKEKVRLRDVPEGEGNAGLGNSGCGKEECRLRNFPPKVRTLAPCCCVTLGELLNLHVSSTTPPSYKLWWELSSNQIESLLHNNDCKGYIKDR